MKALIARFKGWVNSEVERQEYERSLKGRFVCPVCGASEFTLVTNPVFSTSRVSESRTKAMGKCANGVRPCIMRYVFVSKDFGKTWDPYAPSN